MVRASAAPPQVYEFRVAGELGGDWYDWFDGFEVRAAEGVTEIRGPVADQSALYGIIGRLASLGLTLLSLHSENPGTASPQPGL